MKFNFLFDNFDTTKVSTNPALIRLDMNFNTRPSAKIT